MLHAKVRALGLISWQILSMPPVYGPQGITLTCLFLFEQSQGGEYCSQGGPLRWRSPGRKSLVTAAAPISLPFSISPSLSRFHLSLPWLHQLFPANPAETAAGPPR